jgi:sortase (surface protein transpeptidase)
MHTVAPSLVGAALIAFPALAPAGCDSLAARPAATTPIPRRPARPARPTRIVIPAIGVNAPLIALGLDRSGALSVPARFDQAGWWAGGARPGERGPAVIAGHVDSKTGPAIFYRVPKLHRGEHVIVRRRDGTSVRFTVRRRAHYSKARFPTRRVYGPTRRPELRLITCSGVFDRSSGHYLDNTVVYAVAS